MLKITKILILCRTLGVGSPPAGAEERLDVSNGETILPNDKAIPVAIRRIPNAGKKVAITFDDGPYKDMTPKYISVLESFGARATFFVVGNRVQAFPEATCYFLLRKALK
jgi:peptidoglycan/xylan/chitin deacetylase (PgdA/CDA1 family)